MILQRPLENTNDEWVKTLNDCVENGILTQKEADLAITWDGISDTFLPKMAERLFDRSPSKLGFNDTWQSLYKKLVRAS